MDDILSTQNNYRSLSIKDLLAARDLYHYHLLNKANVVGTAIGLYLIRKTDQPSEEERALRGTAHEVPKVKEERTFGNSEVRDYSWPCVLALVRRWMQPDRFGTERGQLHPDQMVPRTLYLPDGRMVPVCVVEVEPGQPEPGRPVDWQWPDSYFGGGMPIIVEPQQRERRATAGCLVSDGHTVYALTSRHVCGTSGEPVFTLKSGHRVQIGRASQRHCTREEFTKIYPEFPSRRTFVNLDVGLIELDDVNDWTSQVYGIQPTGALADLNELNITLRLIEAPVVATGAASGRLEGTIKALFYRYKSVGGYDYVADFLIAPKDPRAPGAAEKVPLVQTQPGDSGAIWHLATVPETEARPEGDREKPKTVYRPLAVEWGGQIFLQGENAEQYAFALATSLTTVCRVLDVELELEQNTGVLPYWGQTGHYSIGSFACTAAKPGKLKNFLTDNIDRISFDIGELTTEEIAKRLKEAKTHEGFVPLADVPDVIWKQHKSKVTGGRDNGWAGPGRSTGPEHPTHYADIDEKGADGQTLRQMCLDDPDKLTPEAWQSFYDAAGHTDSHARGLLPFRVWQFFEAMEEAARRGAADEYLCAAGILAHYVGDACQPLHGSIYSDGYADQPVTITHHRRETGEEYTEESHVGAGVHSTYESKMIDRYAEEIVPGIQNVLQGQMAAIPAITSGRKAALAIVRLMDRSAQRIPPKKLVDTYLDAGGKSSAASRDAMWDKYGQATIGVMADGARTLARIWEGAWAAGKGDNIDEDDLGPISFERLVELYTDETFVESLDLDHIGAALGAAPVHT